MDLVIFIVERLKPSIVELEAEVAARRKIGLHHKALSKSEIIASHIENALHSVLRSAIPLIPQPSFLPLGQDYNRQQSLSERACV